MSIVICQCRNFKICQAVCPSWSYGCWMNVLRHLYVYEMMMDFKNIHSFIFFLLVSKSSHPSSPSMAVGLLVLCNLLVTNLAALLCTCWSLLMSTRVYGSHTVAKYSLHMISCKIFRIKFRPTLPLRPIKFYRNTSRLWEFLHKIFNIFLPTLPGFMIEYYDKLKYYSPYPLDYSISANRNQTINSVWPSTTGL